MGNCLAKSPNMEGSSRRNQKESEKGTATCMEHEDGSENQSRIQLSEDEPVFLFSKQSSDRRVVVEEVYDSLTDVRGYPRPCLVEFPNEESRTKTSSKSAQSNGGFIYDFASKSWIPATCAEVTKDASETQTTWNDHFTILEVEEENTAYWSSSKCTVQLPD